MGSELGPEHDHDMDQTSISQKVFMSGTVCLFCCQSTLMITTDLKGAGSFHIHRKTMKDLGILAVLGVREQPNLAHNLVTHRH